MSRVAAYIINSNGMSNRVVTAMIKGAQYYGDVVDVYADTHYVPEHTEQYDTAVFWGYITTCQEIMRGYTAAGKSAVYLDLAYWDRGNCYKVSVNDRHPTAYFQATKHDDHRRKMFGVEPQPYRYSGTTILLAGMSAKAAWAEKLEPVESWERAAISELKKYTPRSITYRPKPSWTAAKPLEGTEYSNPRTESLERVLARSFAVVTHHSNVAVEGLVAGLPVFAQKGVALPMGYSLLELIGEPHYPNDREQWANDVAYCQWSEKEMKNGTCWSHLKQEELIP